MQPTPHPGEGRVLPWAWHFQFVPEMAEAMQAAPAQTDGVMDYLKKLKEKAKEKFEKVKDKIKDYMEDHGDGDDSDTERAAQRADHRMREIKDENSSKKKKDSRKRKVLKKLEEVEDQIEKL